MQGLGLSDEKIASRADLLGRDPETIERNYQRLQGLGLSDEKIATLAQLLGRYPETIERNYQNHVGFLRQDYNNRNSGRDLLINQAQLLGIPQVTIEANVQFLHSHGIDYNNGLLLGTTPQNKRRKIAYLLRGLFDYRNLPQERKRQAVIQVYNFVRDNPRVLVYSLNTLDKKLPELSKKAAQYKR